MASESSPRSLFVRAGLQLALLVNACAIGACGSEPNATNNQSPAFALEVHGPANELTHSGSWVAKAVLSTDPTWTKLNHEPITIARNTTYAASLWVKGAGTLRLDIVNGAWTANLATITFTATNTWQNISVPNFSSAGETTVNFSLYDEVGGGAGTVFFDDAFLGTPGGVNLVSNFDFEEGSSRWAPSGVFSVVQNPSEPSGSNPAAGPPHSGQWFAKADLDADPTWTRIRHATSAVSPHTTYAASVWVKGAGRLRLDVVNAAWTSNLASVTFDATNTWRQVSVPNFSSGDQSQVNVTLYDDIGGVTGTAYFDDLMLSVPGGPNLLGNADFEAGPDDNWETTGVFSIVRDTGGACTPSGSAPNDMTCDGVDDNCNGVSDEGCAKRPACADGSAPGVTGCPDLLDTLATELTSMKVSNVAQSPDAPPTRQMMELSARAQAEVTRVLESLPADADLGPNDDIRPYVAELGRVVSTNLQIVLPPLGTQPGGGRASNVLESTTLDPSKPMLSDLLERLPYQDDEEHLTLALYRLSAFQAFLLSLNRTELVYLDEGLTAVVVSTVKRLFAKKKSVVALAFYDHVLPVALLVYDLAKHRYTPRVYQILTLDRSPGPFIDVSPDVLQTFRVRTKAPAVLPQKTLDGTLLDYLYCKQPGALHTLSKFGVWLSDNTQGGRLHRLRLGSIDPCEFLKRVTDFTRLGAGDCSLTEIAYSGYQCKSERTCKLGAESAYRLEARPGSSLSKVTPFGTLKKLSAATNCDPTQALGGGESGYLTERPGSECLVTLADVAAAQHPFLDCVANDRNGIQMIEAPKDPWRDRCAVIDCVDGEDCPSDPPMDPDSGGSGDSNDPPDPSCDETCKARELGERHEQQLNQSLERFNKTCGGNCLQPGYAAGVREALQHLPPVTVVDNVSLPGGASGNTRWNADHSGIEIRLNTQKIHDDAYEETARSVGETVEACTAQPPCLAMMASAAAAAETQAEEHELAHAMIYGLMESGQVFTQAGLDYFQALNQGYESANFNDPLLGCNQGSGVACSAAHQLEYEFLRAIRPRGGFKSCGVEGGCGETCGATNSAAERTATCEEYARLVMAEYERRTLPVCRPSRPNQVPSEPQCQFRGCFGTGIDTTAKACPFVLCTGDQQLGDDLACSCCSQCGAGPTPGTGSTPPCAPTVACNQCCIRCDVSDGGGACPGPGGPFAAELTPAWDGLLYSNPTDGGGTTLDTDGDGIVDASDDCPSVANADQHDLDGDGIGYACDSDDEVTGSGTLTRWNDQVTYEMDELVHAHGSGLHVWWSPRDGRTKVWTYARSASEPSNQATDGAQVAATSLTSFSQITDANAFDFTTGAVLVDVGTIAVFRNVVTGTYGALRVDSTWNEGTPSDLYEYRSNMTWIFGGHSSDLSAVPLPHF